MALTTPRGFSGGPMADIDYGIGAGGSAWFEGTAALAPTQPNTGTRTVSLAAGNAAAFGVRVTNDAALTQALTAPSSGAQWYLLVLRFNWSAKTVTLVTISGASSGSTTVPNVAPTTLPSGFTSTPGVSVDVPIAWVLVTSANTLTTIYDLRLYRNGGLELTAANLHALAFANLWLLQDGAIVGLGTWTSTSGQVHAGSTWRRSNGVMTATGRMINSGTVTKAGFLTDLIALLQGYPAALALENAYDAGGLRIGVSDTSIDYGWNGTLFLPVAGGGTTTPFVGYGTGLSHWGTGKSSHLRRSGRVCTLVINVKTDHSMSTDEVIAAVTWAPADSVEVEATLYTGAFQGQRVTLELNSDGGLRLKSWTQQPAANNGIFATISYPAADNT